MISRVNQSQLRKEFDLIIIGGGINGCGIARDASERGLKVLLLEKEDFGYGCTSASTRLIHGGLRYLEHFEFGLVRESLREREILLKNARHLVKPIELCVPIYESDKRGKWLIKAGMVLYDLLSPDKLLPSHKMLSKTGFAHYEPGVKTDGLLGAAVFYDAQVKYPERICVENALMARGYGAMMLNHAEVTNINLQSSEITDINFLDRLTGEKFAASGKLVVNVTGPWVDSLLGLTKKNSERKIGGTKGSHIVVKRFEGGPKHAIYASAKSDGRPFFIIPWQDYYLIGTTDIPFEGDLEHLRANNDEIKYLLQEANQILSSKTLSHGDILFSYSGVRPLPYAPPGTNPAKITRRHIIFDHEKENISNLISVIGGKLTTYRNLSEQVVDLAYRKLNYEFVSTLTKTKPFIGNTTTKLQTKRLQKKFDLDEEIITHLVEIYGNRYSQVLSLIARDPDLGRLLSSHSLDIRAQVEFAIREEMALTLSDVLLRRISLGLCEALGVDAISEVSKLLQSILNLSEAELKKQISEYEENVVRLRKVSG